MVDAVKSTSDNPPKLVGLFADQPLEEVRETVRGSGVDMVQLCGAESMEFCEKVSVHCFQGHSRAGWISERRGVEGTGAAVDGAA